MSRAVLGGSITERLGHDTVDPSGCDWCPRSADAPKGNACEHPPAVHLEPSVILERSHFVTLPNLQTKDSLDREAVCCTNHGNATLSLRLAIS